MGFTHHARLLIMHDYMVRWGRVAFSAQLGRVNAATRCLPFNLYPLAHKVINIIISSV